MALFEKMASIGRRNSVRIITFSFAIVLTLSLLAVKGYNLAVKYRTQLEYTYQRGIAELSEHIENIDITLTKGMYSGTNKGFSDYSMNLWSEASAAKTALSQIPSYNTELDKTYEFLSQIGNYAISLSDKVAAGQEITEQERSTLVSLSNYAKEMKNSIGILQDEIGAADIWSDEIKRTVEEYGDTSPGVLYEGLEKIEQSFSDYPTLLYDGPFSSHIMQSEPQFIKGKDEVTKENAKIKAEKMTGHTLAFAGEEKGSVECYIFASDDITASITKLGGYCYYYLNSREIEGSGISYDEALQKAKEYISGLGLGEFKESYYSVSEGVCVVNFAYTENDIVYYTDLIKVGVALDNGEIVQFNSQGFVMNHTERTRIQPLKTMQDAEISLSPLLEIVSSRQAVVPLETKEEKLCYEFLCNGQNDDQLLVYINADTLEQEDIKLLVNTDGGTLTF